MYSVVCTTMQNCIYLSILFVFLKNGPDNMYNIFFLNNEEVYIYSFVRYLRKFVCNTTDKHSNTQNIFFKVRSIRSDMIEHIGFAHHWWTGGNKQHSVAAASGFCWSSPQSPGFSSSQTRARGSERCCKHCTPPDGEAGSYSAMKCLWVKPRWKNIDLNIYLVHCFVSLPIFIVYFTAYFMCIMHDKCIPN